MARWIGTLNEGSLLRRTLLYIGTFALGSLAFVGVMSLVLVSVAKAVLPPHDAAGSAAEETEEAESEAATGTSKAALGKTSRSKRLRAPSQAERDSAPSAD
ncbi:hypothetical protein SOCE26_106210 [Sorangium cellulosum]|uniref:Uncharacterized protein n=1 Tax=Sorangium cellulosum TaxID=56 RepID=A0A2L0FBU1_SORCE|nr:hypothetical protein [Sorangium cellulosum]AUX49076.1 hypothetical protein SOCE26_106210 [Sorangium cellulosum]